MMYGWSFAARTLDEVCRLITALGKHRYVSEVDHRLHWSVDAALATLPGFDAHAAAFARRQHALDLGSRDPALWRVAPVEEVVAALRAFWGPDSSAFHASLHEALARTGLDPANHAPFTSSAEEPPHPELILLDWVLLPVDMLDADRHKGALTAMADAEEEVAASDPVYQEGPTLASPELCEGFEFGELSADFWVWSDGPYSYSDYVFRGAAKAAKLAEPPLGYHDY